MPESGEVHPWLRVHVQQSCSCTAVAEVLFHEKTERCIIQSMLDASHRKCLLVSVAIITRVFHDAQAFLLALWFWTHSSDMKVFNGHTSRDLKLVWHLRNNNCTATHAQIFDAWLGAVTALIAHTQDSTRSACVALHCLNLL